MRRLFLCFKVGYCLRQHQKGSLFPLWVPENLSMAIFLALFYIFGMNLKK